MREGTVPREEHEQLRCNLQAEVSALSLKLSDLERKHERTCTEVFQITELSKEVFNLKEALNSLSELSGPGKQQNPQEVAKLQGTIKALEQQLAVGIRDQETGVISPPASPLQGHMDEDVQRLLYQILMMQQLQEQGR
uniref:Uncharacterized protein n=1 Tax=Gopherus evgoodei TaxID=1825980 RepID=A0A8C4W7Q2_9SAUR